MKAISFILGFCTALSLSVPVQAIAQSRDVLLEAFAGQWVIFDDSFSNSAAPCTIDLTNTIELRGVVEEAQLRPSATTQNCVVPIDGVSAWDIEGNQLSLYTEQNVLVARLGGNQTRVTGDLETSFRSVVLERSLGDPGNSNFSKALRKHRCIYKGYTADCATKEDLSLPVFSESGGVVASVGVLVDLTVREQPRSTARSVGKLQQGTCLKVNYCVTASDGIWCRARFGEASGWIKKTTLRQSEWPVITFSNSCQDS